MRLKITLIILSLFVSSCDEKLKVDAYKCLFFLKDPIVHSYWYCYNPVLKDEKIIPIQDSNKCIRDNNRECDWQGTDTLEVESARKQIIDQCKMK
jgi:hypothetical protein